MSDPDNVLASSTDGSQTHFKFRRLYFRLWCQLFHQRWWKVIQAYSNRTVKWRCEKCGRVWLGD